MNKYDHICFNKTCLELIELQKKTQKEYDEICQGDETPEKYDRAGELFELLEDLPGYIEEAHSPIWIRDWEGDPSIPNGTNDLSRWECRRCEAIVDPK